jgi:hypothetical protein
MHEMTTEPRSTRRQRLRRLFLLPTGRRRKTRGRHRGVVIPPKPPPVPHLGTFLELPPRSEAVDAVMRKIAERTLAQVAAHEGARVPALAPAVATLTALAPPVDLPAATVLTVATPVVNHPPVKITTLGSTPPTGTPGLDPADIPTMPIMTPDEYLVTEGWDKLFKVVDNDEVDTLSFALKRGGATVRVSDTTIEIPKIPAEVTQTPHICRHCHEMQLGDSLGGRMWRCDGCKTVGAY